MVYICNRNDNTTIVENAIKTLIDKYKKYKRNGTKET